MLEMSRKGSAMKKEWKNIEPFKRHMEEMDCFRRAHANMAPAEPEKTNGLLTGPRMFPTPRHDVAENMFTDEQGRVIVVPIWDVTIPRGSQN